MVCARERRQEASRRLLNRMPRCDTQSWVHTPEAAVDGKDQVPVQRGRLPQHLIGILISPIPRQVTSSPHRFPSAQSTSETCSLSPRRPPVKSELPYTFTYYYFTHAFYPCFFLQYTHHTPLCIGPTTVNATKATVIA
jgi:hypothetical protein